MSFEPAQLWSSLSPNPPATIFDVGAHQGEFSQASLSVWPLAVVHSFEPLRGIANVDGERWHWHKVALSDHNGSETFHRCEFEPSSSLLEMAEAHREAFPYTARSEPVQVPVRRLDEYADLIAAPGLLKVDVQGAELEVLLGAGETLEMFSAVVLEVSHVELYHGQADPELLQDFLESQGFRHSRRVDELRHPVSRELLQSDELWLRS